ncbi:hypothetical protein [Jatrophihabitans endophyticus]|nr:hypothetical protein [Jatrophihabitans endophyticus]MBE7188697.1 hypothetical protein [Jatrophihabitans endophyticus]
MNGMSWYATELLVEERRHRIERDARRAADRHIAREGRRTRRFGHRH